MKAEISAAGLGSRLRPITNEVPKYEFLFDFTDGLITSRLSMIFYGTTRENNGSEHLISHAIDEYYPEYTTIHGLQVGWVHLVIENNIR